MIIDQGAFFFVDGPLRSQQVVCDIRADYTGYNHAEYIGQMAFCALPWRNSSVHFQGQLPLLRATFTTIPFAEAADFSKFDQMGKAARLLFSLFLAVALFATVISQPATAFTAEVAMASMPCCDDDCPQDPSCDMACMAMMRCSAGTAGFAPPAPPVKLHLSAVLVSHGADSPWRVDERQPDGFKRPPRT